VVIGTATPMVDDQPLAWLRLGRQMSWLSSRWWSEMLVSRSWAISSREPG
jgi:hypothetical protein